MLSGNWSRTLRHTLHVGATLGLLAAVVLPACQPEQGDEAPAAREVGADAASGGSGSAEAGGSGHSPGESGGAGTDAASGAGGAPSDASPDGTSSSDARPSDVDAASCTPVACDGLCGPVVEPCSGQSLDCGGCSEGLACDVDEHRCVAPKVGCEDLGVECGRARNTCGKRLDCGDCSVGLECDVNTNRCVACSEPTCLELGYECGPAWLGCGAREVLTDCGTCGAGFVCNPDYNRCEPAPVTAGGTCVPPPAAEKCAADRADCGFVSDGCGDLVFCGDCPTGEGCGVSGISNRCTPLEAAWECIAEQRECGRVTSECGGRVECGRCAQGLVCNENGRCGTPCTPTLPPDAAQVACGSFDDGCDGRLEKACPGGGRCLDGRCCTPDTCAADHAGECGEGLADGCGGTLDCRCRSGTACPPHSPGQNATCCDLPLRPAPDFCGTLSNTCGSRTFGCGPGATCVDGVCCPLPVCAEQCGTTLTNACGSVTCGCADRERCVSGACCAPRTCGGAYRGQCGSGLDDGCGGTLDCACRGDGNSCSTTRAGTTGTCSCTALDCGDHPNQCGRFPNDCGGALDCTCADHGLSPSMRCGGGGDPGVCGCTKAACAGQCGLVEDGCDGTMDCGPC